MRSRLIIVLSFRLNVLSAATQSPSAPLDDKPSEKVRVQLQRENKASDSDEEALHFHYQPVVDQRVSSVRLWCMMPSVVSLES